MFYALLQSARGWTASVIHGWQVSLSAFFFFFFLNGDCTHHIHTAGDSDMPQWVCVCERERNRWIESMPRACGCDSLLWKATRAQSKRVRLSSLCVEPGATENSQRSPHPHPTPPAPAPAPPVPTSAPSLRLCAPAMPSNPWKAFLPAINVSIYSPARWMNLHLRAKRPYLKSAAVASPRACCLSIMRLCLLWGRSWENLLGLVAAAPRSGARLPPCFASSLCKWRPLKKQSDWFALFFVGN